MKLRTLIAATTTTLFAAAPVAAQDHSDWPDNFTLGTASQGGTYFAYGSGWANFVSENLNIAGGAEITGGPMQNMALVQTGDLKFGLTTMGPAQASREGNSPLAPGMKMDNVCAMFPMYQTPFSVTALASSDIESIEDIPDGAKIGFGPAGSTSDTYFPKMMKTLGVDFERQNGSWSDLGTQLQDGLIDVVAFAAGIPVPAISQLEVQAGVNIISFTGEERQKVINQFPVSRFTIPAETYQSLDQGSDVVSMWNFSIANCDVPDSLVYEMTKLTMENNDRMVSIHKAAQSTVPGNVGKNTALPWHPGAARWFRENGYGIPDSRIK